MWGTRLFAACYRRLTERVMAVTDPRRGQARGYAQRFPVMRIPTTKVCPNSNQPCMGKCSGYGTSSNCPPLIVLAVLATCAYEAAEACR
jgi:hypothetical protein